MTRLFDFSLRRQGLEDVRFVVCRNELPPDGDLEFPFFDGLADLHRHSSGNRLSGVLARLAKTSEISAVIRNPRLVLDADLPRRIKKARESLDSIGDWALAGAGGLGLNDRYHMALYASECPAIPEFAGLQPVVDVMPDFYLVNAAFINRLSAPLTTFDTALELTLVTQGYLEDHVSVFAPDLTAAIDGDLIPRAIGQLADEIGRAFCDRLSGQAVSSLSGPIILSPKDVVDDRSEPRLDLESTIVQGVSSRADAPKFTILTRTRFQRLYLLRRMLTSISRARSADVPFEVVLSSDTEPEFAEGVLEALQKSFVHLDLRLRSNPQGGHSRVTNLLGGVQAASGEYILILDDDDFIDPFAFELLLPAFFAGNRPLVAATTECHVETWEETPSRRWVLAHSASMTSYPASGWREMFCGINKLPICGLAIPRERLEARLKTLEFRYNLSEDYALFLLVLTDPNLPDVYECTEPVAHISIRGSENSVLMRDRRPWVHDIMRFLSDVAQSQEVTGPGQLSLNTASSNGARADFESCALSDLQDLLRKRNREIQLLRRELQELRRIDCIETETAA